uniref:uncharacterized protein LOC122589566 isoform X1 n=1 Tax=Erigeron canadensis TaxID=72917 RepID=UPI001CB8EA13|nr:uncharacterized protein LOC122589566 isoform X1 [Erigeron canadensis]
MRRKLCKLVLPIEAFDSDIENQSEPNTYSESVSRKGKVVLEPLPHLDTYPGNNEHLDSAGDGFEPGKEIGRSSKKPKVVEKALSKTIIRKYSEPNATSELGVTVEGSTPFGTDHGDSEYVDLADDEFEPGNKVGHDSNISRVVVSSPETKK